MASKYAQTILFFYCRPCGDYHEKTHPHFAEQQARAVERRKKATDKEKGKKRRNKAAS